jgi:hypothetical protein
LTSKVSQEPMPLKKASAMMKYRSEWRIASAIYFAIAGSLLISGLSLAAPSQWFVFLAWSFAASAVAWAWRPRVAAAISAGAVFGLIFLFRYCSSLGDGLFLSGVLGIASIFIIMTFRFYPPRTGPGPASTLRQTTNTSSIPK